MTELWNQISAELTLGNVMTWTRAAVLLFAGLLVAKLAGGTVRRLAAARLEPQQTILFRRIAYYLVLSLFVIAALNELGFDLGVLLGAAGIVTVAVGFASQTSVSNLISGLFLIAERPFSVGDHIQVGDISGLVLSIDLMSVKLRSFDNQFIRIPNETLIKTEVRNLTKFPIRRTDIHVGIAYKEDVARVRELLLEIADRNPLCLTEPPPLFLFSGYGDSSIDLMLGAWALRENWFELKVTLPREIKEAFDAEGIEIPFPHVSLYTGTVTEPFPVKVVASST